MALARPPSARDRASAQADRLDAVWSARLARLAPTDEMRELELVPEETDGPRAGTRPMTVVRDPSGRRYLFKAAEPRMLAGEIFAYGVRRLGKRPALPTIVRELELPGIGPTMGMLQPLLEHEGEQLPADATLWSPMQREVMLREHPWEWLLANLDTHADQYVLLGPERYPLDIDWDHSLFDLDVTRLDRFTKRMPAIAPLRNALYDAYVHGRVDLDFGGLREQARRITRLDERRLGELVADYARRVSLSEEAAARTARELSARKRRLVATFDRLIADLRSERRALREPGGGSANVLAMRAVRSLQDAWQRLVLNWLHERALNPLFRLYRRLLALRLVSHRGR